MGGKRLFDDLVGAGEDRRRDVEAELFRGLEIDDQLEGRRLHHREIGRFGAVEDEGGGDQVPWPADKVERWSIDRLIPYAKNSRTHSEAQVAQLAASMQEWGWTNPVLADEAGGVICGHARILAARQLGYAEVPVMVARGWSDAQKRAYVIAITNSP